MYSVGWGLGSMLQYFWLRFFLLTLVVELRIRYISRSLALAKGEERYGGFSVDVNIGLLGRGLGMGLGCVLALSNVEDVMRYNTTNGVLSGLFLGI